MKELPEELGFLKSLKKISVEKTFDIELGDNVFTFKLLKMADQTALAEKLKISSDLVDALKQSKEAGIETKEDLLVNKNIIQKTNSLFHDYRVNSLVYSLKAVNGDIIPSFDQKIIGEDGNQVTIFDSIKNLVLDWPEPVFNYVISEVEKQQGLMLNDIKGHYKLDINPVDTKSSFDYSEESEMIKKEEEAFLEEVNALSDNEHLNQEVVPQFPVNVPQNTFVKKEEASVEPVNDVLPSQEDYFKKTAPVSEERVLSGRPVPESKATDEVRKGAPKLKRN